MKDFKIKVTLPELPEGLSGDLNFLLSNAKIASNIPNESGLGSSAALSVSLARCLKNDPQQIFNLAKKFEDQFHSGSSGLDVFTSANGGLCRLNSGTSFEKLPNNLLENLQIFRFSLIDTNQKRKVGEIKSQICKADLDQFLLEAVDISKEFEEGLLFSKSLSLDKMVSLFDRTQKALVKLKVSTPLIDSITSFLKEKFDDLGVKITGAGGGGCLLLVHNEAITKESLSKALNHHFNNLTIFHDIKFAE